MPPIISSMASLPMASPHYVMVGAVGVAVLALIIGTLIVLIYRNHRHLRAPVQHAHDLDVEAQDQSLTHKTKTGQRIHIWSTLSAADIMSGSRKATGELPLPAVHVRVTASARLRDSVLCKAIGQLPWPGAGKPKVSLLLPPLSCEVLIAVSISRLPASRRGRQTHR